MTKRATLFRTTLILSILTLAIGGGIVVASLLPQLSRTVRATIASLPLPGLASFREPEAARTADRKAPLPVEKGSSVSPKREDGVLELTPERIALANIEVAAVRGGRLGRHITVPGTIAPAPDRISRVPAKVVGNVTDMRKRLGDPVSKGEVVAVLDSREVAEARSAYLTADVNLNLQKTVFDRAQLLWSKKITAESQFLQARATFADAQLRLDLARQKLMALQLDPKEMADVAKQGSLSPAALRLSQYQIRSPARGRVVERKVDVGGSLGQLNDPTELYTLVDLTVVWAELAVSTADRAFVKQGQRVLIMSGSRGTAGHRAEGKIVFVSPMLEKDTRSAKVAAEIANPGEAWTPGLFVTAEISLEDEPAGVVVPRTALQTIGTEPVVFVRTPEGFRKRVVVLGRAGDDSVEITEGLQSGEKVAVANSFALKAELGRAQIED